MKNPGAFLEDTLRRLRRSISITGTNMNFKGRKAIPYSAFEERFWKRTEYALGEDPKGYYGVRLYFEVDGTDFIFDTHLRRAMVWDTNKKTGKRIPYILDIKAKDMIRFLDVWYASAFGDHMLRVYNSTRVWWTDYTFQNIENIA